MVQAIQADPYFRWFDSGDMYHIKLAHKMLEVMQQTPNTQHWLPTRMHKFPKFREVIKQMRKLPNVTVRVSSDSINGQYDKRQSNTSTIIPSLDTPTAASVCPAYQNDGKCNDCRQCWDKSIKVIAYPAHGKKMTSIIARSN
jgi:hypothetical protein